MTRLHSFKSPYLVTTVIVASVMNAASTAPPPRAPARDLTRMNAFVKALEEPSHETVAPEEVIRSRTLERIAQNYGKLPMTFEENDGQTDARVRFLSRGSGFSLFFTSTESILVLRKPVPVEPRRWLAPQLKSFSLLSKPVSDERLALHMTLLGSNPYARIQGLEELPGKANYLIGNDPTKWHTNVRTYAKVGYRGVYPGIDLIYYGNREILEYDLVVAAGADPHSIALSFQGADKLEVDPQGDLLINTALGVIRQRRPNVYQEIAGVHREIPASYALKGRHQAAFQLADYDATKPLVIDPLLIYSTLLGGTSLDDSQEGIAADAAGNAYVTGETSSTTFPTTAGALQATIGGNLDIFVTKLNPSGSGLVYATYIGGSSDDGGRAIAVDALGNAYLTGYSTSADFPITNGAIQTTFGGYADAFVTKLNSTGSLLVYSTYLGGNGGDSGVGIALDSLGSAYVTGFTHCGNNSGCSSTNFPITAGAFQATYGGGSEDAFVTKVNAAGTSLVFSTYLGGSDADQGQGIVVDLLGSAYVTGYTQCFSGNGCVLANFPTTSGAFQSSALAGTSKSFVTKLNTTGTGLVYSTYLGGSGNESPGRIAVDTSGSAYVTGFTNSVDFPTTSGAFQRTYGGLVDSFVTKLNSSGSGLVYSTYLGGSGTDVGQGIAVDSLGSAYVTGFTNSANFPTAVALQPAFGGGFNGDAFVTKLSASGSALLYSTYLGGSDDDWGVDIAVDALPTPNAYIAGRTNSSDFPTTAGAFQTTGGRAFVVKIAGDPPPPPPPPPGIGPPTNIDQCKNGGWQMFNVPRTFKNQGDCIQFVNTGK